MPPELDSVTEILLLLRQKDTGSRGGCVLGSLHCSAVALVKCERRRVL